MATSGRTKKGDVLYRDGEQRVVATADVVELPGTNPNVLSAEQDAELEASIRTLGFRQPITVVATPDGRLLLSDGAHRLAVARRLAIAAVPAIVKDGTEEDVRKERLALNRIRGQVDLGAAAADLRWLAEQGNDMAQLGPAVGFTDEELAVLLAARPDDGRDLVADAGGAGVGEPMVEHAKRYSLTLVYDTLEARDAARAELLARGPSVEEGLRNLLGGGQ